ncbi:hypothetical protein [Pseudoalteromonas sp. NC201]|uniref:hypothetical protein n=1 Tax=Pseudoalteromonas sp. NC201 TaxID=1514074 RepID=UPI000CA0BD4D|nr:hypothetical protein [Pseudoalteromonas sp. NC201]AUJ72420.1 hypothetical protein PNC201_21020 [Pseudoalteromonas sp. NC201]
MKKFLLIRNVLLSVFSILGGAYFLVSYLIDPLNGFPDKNQLTEVTGHVEWIEPHKYGVRFKFESQNAKYNYPSKTNAMGLVQNSLENANGLVVAILTRLDETNTNHITGKKYHTVYALSVGGKNIRTYEEMADAWASDNKVGLFLGPFLIFAGFYIAIKAKRGEYT